MTSTYEPKDKTIEIKDVFLELYHILKEEKEDNWIRGIKGILFSLDEILQEGMQSKIHLIDIHKRWIQMNMGSNSFSDFFIWKDDFDERVEANKPLDKIKLEITKLFEDVLENK